MTMTDQDLAAAKKYSAKKIKIAVSSVVKALIIDAFMIEGSHRKDIDKEIDKIFASVPEASVKGLPAAVERELVNRYFSNMLNNKTYSRTSTDKFGEQAEAEDWGDALSQIVNEAFDLNPMQSMRVLGEINAVLRKVSKDWGFKSQYLPRSVRYALRSNRLDI